MITSNVSKFRDMADRLESEIADKRRSRDENTPKKQLQAKSARLEADHLERVQRAMYALAEAQENDSVPEILRSIKSKSELMSMLKTRLDGSSGYYSLVDTGEFHDCSEKALALRTFIEASKDATTQARDAEQARVNRIKDMESQVRFAKITGFHPSPPDVCQRMIDKVQHFDGTGVILEPSVGNAELAEFAASKWPNAQFSCCEINHTLCAIAEAKGFTVLQGDFLAQPAAPIANLVLMNPIFEGGADVDHIRHAWDFVVPGGELVAIASAGIKFNSRKKYEAFRMFLTEADADIHDLPVDSFQESMVRTGVSTVLLYLRKPE